MRSRGKLSFFLSFLFFFFFVFFFFCFFVMFFFVGCGSVAYGKFTEFEGARSVGGGGRSAPEKV